MEVAATNGFNTVTAKMPIASAVAMGETKNRRPERPAARTTTSSDDLASPKNNVIPANTITNGKIKYIFCGTFSTAKTKASATPIPLWENRRICSIRSIRVKTPKNTPKTREKLPRKRRAI